MRHLYFQVTQRIIKMNVIIYVTAILFSCYDVGGESVTVCDEDVMSLSCEGGKKLVIEEAHYGRSDAHSCPSGTGSSGNTNCNLEEILSILNGECFGKNSCQFPIGKKTLRDPCPGTSKYLTAKYSCAEATQIIQVCNTFYIKQSSGYLVSPNYPNPYNPKVTCLSEIVQQPGYGTKTTLIDLEMEARSTTGCYDWLSLLERDNPGVKLDYCGNMQSVKEKEHDFNHLTVRFQPDAMNNFRGFLIKFEAVPLNKVEGHAIAEKSKTVDSGEAKIEELKKTLLELEQAHKDKLIKKQKELEEKRRLEEAERERQRQEQERQKQEEERKRREKEQKVKQQKMQKEVQRKAFEAAALKRQAEEAAQKMQEVVKREKHNYGDIEPHKKADLGTASGCTRSVVPIPAHAYISVLKEGKRVTIECTDGYNMDDEDNGLLVCHGNSWAGSPGTCLPRSCGQPDLPENGEVIFSETVVGSNAEYICHRKYRLVGDSTRKCTEDGSWSGSAPYCTATGGRSLSLVGEVIVAVILTVIFMYLRRKCRSCRLQLQLPVQFAPVKEAQL